MTTEDTIKRLFFNFDSNGDEQEDTENVIFTACHGKIEGPSKSLTTEINKIIVFLNDDCNDDLEHIKKKTKKICELKNQGFKFKEIVIHEASVHIEFHVIENLLHEFMKKHEAKIQELESKRA